MTSVMEKGYKLLGTGAELSLKKNTNKIRFGRKMKSSGNLYGINIITCDPVMKNKSGEKQMKINKYNQQLEPPSDKNMGNTTKCYKE